MTLPYWNLQSQYEFSDILKGVRLHHNQEQLAMEKAYLGLFLEYYQIL